MKLLVLLIVYTSTGVDVAVAPDRFNTIDECRAAIAAFMGKATPNFSKNSQLVCLPEHIFK